MRELYVDDIAAQKDRHYDDLHRGRHHGSSRPPQQISARLRRPSTEELWRKPTVAMNLSRHSLPLPAPAAGPG